MPASLDREIDRLVGTRVRIHADGRTYEGWLQSFDRDPSTVLLRDVERADGEQFDSILAAEPDLVEALTDVTPIEHVPVTSLEPSKYDAREYDPAAVEIRPEIAQQVREICLSGTLSSFPVVNRVTTEHYEILSGHRRITAARHLEYERVPVRITDLDEWEATRRFVYEHFPFPSERPDRPPELYTDEEMAESLELLQEDWPEERLRRLLPLQGVV